MIRTSLTSSGSICFPSIIYLALFSILSAAATRKWFSRHCIAGRETPESGKLGEDLRVIVGRLSSLSSPSPGQKRGVRVYVYWTMTTMLLYQPVGGYHLGQIALGGFLVLSARISLGRSNDIDSGLPCSFFTPDFSEEDGASLGLESVVLEESVFFTVASSSFLTVLLVG